MKRRIGILTVSDKGYGGEREDLSAQVIRRLVAEGALGYVTDYRLVPDEEDRIRGALIDMADHGRADLILTTGGTGLGPRDVTPEATRAVIQREVPGLADKMRMDGMARTPLAALSRGIAGIRGRTLIVNLPGSPRAVEENLSAILPMLPHALDVVTGSFGDHDGAKEGAAAPGAAPERKPLNEITDGPLRIEDVLNKVLDDDHGATLIFVGTARKHTRGRATERLEYEAYLPMALAAMDQIGEEVARKWPGARCAMTHRTGKVEIGEASVVIAVSAAHRDECYAASRYAIERLKQIVPIWKQEIYEDGAEWKGDQTGTWNPLETPE